MRTKEINMTFLDNIDSDKVNVLLDKTKSNVVYFNDSVAKVVNDYSHDLDGLMVDLHEALTQPDRITTDDLERYYAELTSLLYFMSTKLEQLNVYNDMSKAMAKEVYNKSYIDLSSEKDGKGKSLKTVAEITSVAELDSQYETTVNQIYEHAYKLLKNKIDSATEMVTTLKNILKRRISEDYINKNVTNLENYIGD